MVTLKIVVALGAGALAVALSGCSDTGDTHGSGGVLTSEYSNGYLGSPIDAVLQADEGYLAQEQAIYDFRKSCMTDAGFKFNASRPSLNNLNEDRSPRVTPLSLDNARSDGFRSLITPSADDSQTQTTESAEYFATLQRCTVASPAYHATQSDEYVALQKKFYEQLYDFEARYSAGADLAAINKDWRSCVSNAGYEGDTPAAVLERYNVIDPALPVTETERAAAVTYASCLDSVGYIMREATLRMALEAEFVTENEQLISEMLAARYDK
ncbi:MAG: hypothetical protein F2772_05365 [Actinobacteria bacterium]|uniref:Unannotated protein n=1 Tax=freshwater metagenome TaxID=449393 RepID=A0A6J6ZAL5_9ZZZZ|nr:hypothetical protein [Actinomycetota bacterium]MSW78616.1 hypothetical protein [Actinomycetota bacterium]MSX54941.1 hypothetical protein [Actinomycetota bacterium]MTB19054.1 hypothetical protein [Actinomycetota bacterium]